MESKISFLICVIYSSIYVNYCLPVTTSDSLETSTDENFNSTNDLYVIREVVYEVGILTPEDNTTVEDDESHEVVDLKFFNPNHNESFIDLSNIPVPVQTNVSGHLITELAPVNFGSLKLTSTTNESNPLLQSKTNTEAETDKQNGVAGTVTYPLANAVVSVTTNISTTNGQTGSEILQALPPILGLAPVNNEANKA